MPREGGTLASLESAVLVTNHVLAGAAIGALVKRPLPALAVGVVSHLAMDSIPHWGLPHEDCHGDMMQNPAFLRVAYRDGVAGLAAMGAAFGLARGRRLPVLAGMVGAALLDLDKPGRYFVGISPFPKAVDRFHARIQREHDHKMGQELAVAAGLAALVAGCLSGRLRRPRPASAGLLRSVGPRPTPAVSGERAQSVTQSRLAMATTGLVGGRLPSEPVNGRSEKVKTPPSSPTIR